MKRDDASPVMEGAVCPVPLAHDVTVVMGMAAAAHDARSVQALPARARNPALEQGDDAACCAAGGTRPPGHHHRRAHRGAAVLPGGDIGAWRCAARSMTWPHWRTHCVTPPHLEEGLRWRRSIGGRIDARRGRRSRGGDRRGDTKVAEGARPRAVHLDGGRRLGAAGARSQRTAGAAGDACWSRARWDHGIAVLEARGGWPGERDRVGCRPIHGLVEALFDACRQVHVLRDPRGRPATTLNEIAPRAVLGSNWTRRHPRSSGGAVGLRAARMDRCTWPMRRWWRWSLPPKRGRAELCAAALRRRCGAHRHVLAARPPGADADGHRGTRVVDMLAGEMLPRIC